MGRFNRDDYNNYDRGDYNRENNNFDRNYDAREYSRDYNREPYNNYNGNNYNGRDTRANDPARPYNGYNEPPIDNRQGYNKGADSSYRDNRYNNYQNDYNRDNRYNESQSSNYARSYPNNNEFHSEPYYYNGYKGSEMTKSEKDWAANNVKDMVVCSPKDYKDIQNLINNLKNKQALIVDVNNLTPDKVQRFLDFLSGAIYALGGSCQQVGKALFLFTPQGVSITIPYDFRQKNMKDDK